MFREEAKYEEELFLRMIPREQQGNAFNYIVLTRKSEEVFLN